MLHVRPSEEAPQYDNNDGKNLLQSSSETKKDGALDSDIIEDSSNPYKRTFAIKHSQEDTSKNILEDSMSQELNPGENLVREEIDSQISYSNEPRRAETDSQQL